MQQSTAVIAWTPPCSAKTKATSKEKITNINNGHHFSQRQKMYIDPLTLDEINRIITDAKANPETRLTAVIVELVVQTRMRVGELRNLRLADFDWAAEVIRVHSDKPAYFRYVPLSNDASRAPHALCAGCGNSEYVLGKSAAKHMRRAAMQFPQIAKKLTIAAYALHSLRYTLAMRLICSGMDFHLIQRLLYNHSAAMTPHRYLRS